MTSSIVTQQVRDAKAGIAKLRRPDHISKLVWGRIKKLLAEIANHLPDPYPGMRRLAKRLGCSVGTVCTHVRLAEEAGLLTRESIGGVRDGMRYTLAWCSVPAFSSEHKEESPTGTRPPSSKEDSVVAGRVRRADFGSRRRNRYPGECCVCGGHLFAGQGFLHGRLPVHEQCDTGAMASKWKDDPDNPDNWSREEAIGDRPEPPKVTQLKSDPAVRLARTFENLWISTALKNRELQGMRVIDIGPAVGYLRAKMLTHMTPEHIEAYIVAFVEDTRAGEVGFKEGQSAWSRFTGWWGTTEVPDPSVRQAQVDERRRVQEMIARGEGIVRSSLDETYGTSLRSVVP